VAIVFLPVDDLYKDSPATKKEQRKKSGEYSFGTPKEFYV
jgi:hypothetical protein